MVVRVTEKLMQNTLPLPPPARISMESPQPLPHFFVGDAAFPLRTNLMRPYPGFNLPRTKRIFNYRLSRARSVIENSFGILTARWRILRTSIECDPKNCEKVVLACIVLHNFIILNDHNRWYCPENYVDRQEPGNIVHCGEWRREINILASLFQEIDCFQDAILNLSTSVAFFPLGRCDWGGDVADVDGNGESTSSKNSSSGTIGGNGESIEVAIEGVSEATHFVST
ncbi:uncharacterized protein LOC129250653 [Anastrepha obliqua]|uniref:uncharacterized protein LOC129250653 n=1 Tax=Anastrepha obliqua TaxID=95512 RepID=UPI0024094B2D|nr:uncharacterized protein LOC129250653 [Anastrepha obliqua]